MIAKVMNYELRFSLSEPGFMINVIAFSLCALRQKNIKKNRKSVCIYPKKVVSL
jgi:hypothetical protein